MIVFGPVPSRRLGRSLGINNIPPKHCSYSCLYCQVGPTKATEIKPSAFYDPEAIFNAVVAHLEKLKEKNESVDYLTFVPDGEPLLDARLGETIALLRRLNIKIAVISNGSLICQEPVRDILKMVDWVSLKIDSVDVDVWQRINRPHEKMGLKQIMSAMLTFAEEYQGTLVTETMLLEGINTDDDSVSRLAAFLQKLAPDTVYLAVPTRPTADSSALAPAADTINEVYQTLIQSISHVELLTGYEGTAFAATGNFAEDILSITAVHPMRKDAVLMLLDKCHEDWRIVQQMLEKGQLQEVDYQGHYFYLNSNHHAP
ncbi:radical SAM protein [Methylicorpusculum oleiharenae]|uniref:radical SAM protein n=1 Tax=Methylicorpusculum oleiharenae TaxID=1338687 RepID=UPI00135C195D|nr:radical SAM protein [Methylicorpusculum oleiharenae]MCD2451688.1 radical SAM protein [Methylicorpusculum oleiharenae]